MHSTPAKATTGMLGPIVRFRAAVAMMIILAPVTLAACRQAVAPAGTLAEGAVKILVEADGLYQVSYANLRDAGLTNDDLAGAGLDLTQAGRSIPFIQDEAGIIFYGQAATSPYTRQRAYILTLGASGAVMTDRPATVAIGTPRTTLPQTMRLERDRIYASSARSAASDSVWFWQTIQPESSVTISATLPAVAPGPASLTMSLWGASYNNEVAEDHDFDLLVNGHMVATVRWDGQTTHRAAISLPEGVLLPGRNEFLFDNTGPGATFVDTMQLDWLELTYTAPALAVDDRLQWMGDGEPVTLGGFTAQPLILDISDPAAPQRLNDWSFNGGQVSLRIPTGQTILAVGPAGLRQPAAISGVRSSDWHNPTQQADLLIVTTDELAPALSPLVTARVAEGLSVALVTVAEIYDGFGGGEASPESIAAFVQYAVTRWSPPAPRYLLLVGEATYDYRGNLGPGPANVVPPLLIPVQYSGETVSDARLGDIDGDLRPDLAVGRWPVSDVSAVASLVERTLAYEKGPVVDRAIFAADGTEQQFAVLSDRFLAQAGLDESQIARLYGAPSGDVAAVWNQGAWLVSYTGHGSLDQWGKDDVFSNEAVRGLKGASAPPIVLQFTCLTGFFAHPTMTSISEALLLADDGPVLQLAATSLTLSTHQEPLAIGLLSALSNPAYERIGDALLAAKRGLDVSIAGIREVSDTFGLLGDPSARIIRPESASG